MAALVVSAFWPRFVDLDDLPDTATARHYRAEAKESIALLRDHPLQQAFDAIVVQRWRFSHWRVVPGSGEGSTSVPEAMDVLVDATALGPWGIPVNTLTICCGGAGTSTVGYDETPRSPTSSDACSRSC